MTTECSRESFLFHDLGRREVMAHLDGGDISSDAGALLLREAEHATGLIDHRAACFTDHRDPRFIEHTLEEVLAQRIYGIALGSEDLVDHDELRRDPLIATLVGKRDMKGRDRRRASNRGTPLAGKSTLNRLKLGADTERLATQRAMCEHGYLEFRRGRLSTPIQAWRTVTNT
jgi:Transposase DDE domain group 1